MKFNKLLFLLKEMDMEEIFDLNYRDSELDRDDSDSVEQDFKNWYELEYKHSFIKNKMNTMDKNQNPRLFTKLQDYLSIITKRMKELNKVLADSFYIPLFEWWLSKHEIDPQKSYESFIEDIHEGTIIDDYEEILNILEQRCGSFLRGQSPMRINDVIKNIKSFDSVKNLIEDMKQYEVTEWENIVREDWEEELESGEKTEEDVEQEAINKIEDYYENEIWYDINSLKDVMSVFSSHGSLDDFIKEFYIKIYHPLYVKWVDEKFNLIDGVVVPFKEILKNLEQIEQYPLEKQNVILNHAKNAQHANGSILDYAYDIGFYDIDFKTLFKKLSSLDPEEEGWNDELRDIGVEMKKLEKKNYDEI